MDNPKPERLHGKGFIVHAKPAGLSLNGEWCDDYDAIILRDWLIQYTAWRKQEEEDNENAH